MSPDVQHVSSFTQTCTCRNTRQTQAPPLPPTGKQQCCATVSFRPHVLGTCCCCWCALMLVPVRGSPLCRGAFGPGVRVRACVCVCMCVGPLTCAAVASAMRACGAAALMAPCARWGCRVRQVRTERVAHGVAGVCAPRSASPVSLVAVFLNAIRSTKFSTAALVPWPTTCRAG